MSKDSRMKLTRSASKRLTKQRIILVSEGTKTELEYIELLKNLFNEITERFYLNILKKRTSKGDPKGLLEVLKKENKREFDADDEIWVLIDRDDWNKEHIEELKGAHKSLKLKTKDFQVLISNPKFELWLLYHFKNAPKVGSVKKLDEALNKQWPRYDKAIPRGKFKREDVLRAADQAKRICAVRDKSIESDPEADIYYSEVYKLLERLGILN